MQQAVGPPPPAPHRYVYVPVLLSALLLGERLDAPKAAGCALGGVAVVLLGASWGGRRQEGGGPASDAAAGSPVVRVSDAGSPARKA